MIDDIQKNTTKVIFVLGAGSGRRMGRDQNKMYLRINEIPLIFRTISKLNEISWINHIYVVIREEDREDLETVFHNFGSPGKLKGLILGGQERSDSVRCALSEAREYSPDDVILIHDGARPFISEELVGSLVSDLKENSITVPGVAVSDTIRQSDTSSGTRIIDRSNLFAMQTPQVFYRDNLEVCFFSENVKRADLTDEASYFEKQGLHVEIVPGDKKNIKVTTPEDVRLAEYYLATCPELRIENEVLKYALLSENHNCVD